VIEDSNKPFYDGCVVRYMRLFAMVKLFQLKASNGWSDGSFKQVIMTIAIEERAAPKSCFGTFLSFLV
jgi:hypothetical protein